MKINADLRKHFKSVETQFIQATKPFVTDYNVSIDINEVPEFKLDDIEDLRTEHFPSFSMDITISSNVTSKKIEFSLHDGVNVMNMHYNALQFSISQLEDTKSSWFNLQDYMTHNNINQKVDDFFAANVQETAAKKIDVFIQQIVLLMERDDIKRILNSKDWIDVPHDKSMYF